MVINHYQPTGAACRVIIVADIRACPGVITHARPQRLIA